MAKTASKKAAPKQAANETTSKVSAEQEPLLQQLFLDEVKDIYWAEKHLLKALPKLQKAATSPELQQAFEKHTAQTQEQIGRLEQVFELLGSAARAKKCEAMEGLVKEAQSVIEDTEKGTATRDVALILAAQKAEHYEIATYGGLKQLATVLGMDEAAGLFDATLNEEKETDQLLTQIAENNVNYEASEEGEEDTEEE